MVAIGTHHGRRDYSLFAQPAASYVYGAEKKPEKPRWCTPLSPKAA